VRHFTPERRGPRESARRGRDPTDRFEGAPVPRMRHAATRRAGWPRERPRSLRPRGRRGLARRAAGRHAEPRWRRADAPARRRARDRGARSGRRRVPRRGVETRKGGGRVGRLGRPPPARDERMAASAIGSSFSRRRSAPRASTASTAARSLAVGSTASVIGSGAPPGGVIRSPQRLGPVELDERAAHPPIRPAREVFEQPRERAHRRARERYLEVGAFPAQRQTRPLAPPERRLAHFGDRVDPPITSRLATIAPPIGRLRGASGIGASRPVAPDRSPPARRRGSTAAAPSADRAAVKRPFASLEAFHRPGGLAGAG